MKLDPDSVGYQMASDIFQVVMARPALIMLLIWLVSMFGAIYIAIRRGQSLLVAICLGAIGPIGVVIVALLPTTERGRQLNELYEEAKFDAKTITCPNCGRVNSRRSKVCPRCDTRIETRTDFNDDDADDDPELIPCSNCGRLISIHSSICPRCETRLV